MQTKIDAGAIRCLGDLTQHLARKMPAITPMLDRIQMMATESEGRTLGELLNDPTVTI